MWIRKLQSTLIGKKKSGYCSFMVRDGPRTLGLKEIPQVGFKDQDLIVNSPLYLLHIFL